MPALPKISDAEWKIMKRLWKKSPQPAYDLAQALVQSEGWSSRTVKTLLNRLLKKKALGFTQYKNLYLYHPLVAEDACVRLESDSFLKQVFDGSLSNLLVHFARQRKLSKKEIQELRNIVNKMEG